MFFRIQTSLGWMINKGVMLTQEPLFTNNGIANPPFLQDPNHYQKQGNYHRKIAIACVVWIVAGILVQGVVIMRLYGRHTATLDKATEQNAMILTASRASAMNYTTLEEHREAFEQRFQTHPRLHSSTLEEYNVEKEV